MVLENCGDVLVGLEEGALVSLRRNGSIQNIELLRIQLKAILSRTSYRHTQI